MLCFRRINPSFHDKKYNQFVVPDYNNCPKYGILFPTDKNESFLDIIVAIVFLDYLAVFVNSNMALIVLLLKSSNCKSYHI